MWSVLNKGLSLALLLAICQQQGWSQTFNKRFDHADSLQAEGSNDIELHPSGYLVFGGFRYIDTIQITPTRTSLLLDPVGNRIWDKHYYTFFASNYHGWANGLDRTADGGYIGAGALVPIDSVVSVYLVRYDQNADTIWTRTWGDGIEDWIGRQVKHTLDGGFIVVGETGASGFIDGFALKTDSLGNEEWLQFYGGGGVVDGFVAIGSLPDSGYYLGGQKNVSAFDKNLWVVRIDKSGNISWEKNWGTSFDEPNAHLMAASDGHCVVAAALGYGDDFLPTRPYMAKLDSADGSFIWEKEYGPTGGSTGFFTVKECANTDYIAAGVTYVGGGGQRGLLLRTDNNGDSLWMRDYYYADTATGITQGRARFWDVVQTADGGFIGCGWVLADTTSPGYSQDTWVVKVDSMGCIVPGCDSTGVGITEQVTNLTDAIKVWPNPVQSGGSINIQLELPKPFQGKELQVTMINTLGQRVGQQLITNPKSPVILSSPKETGVYYLHLTDGTRWLSGTKFIVE